MIAVTGRHTSSGIHSGLNVVANNPADPDFGTLGMVLRRLGDTDLHFLTCAHIAQEICDLAGDIEGSLAGTGESRPDSTTAAALHAPSSR